MLAKIGDLNDVATAILGGVEGFISFPHQGFQRLSVLLVDGNADGGCHFQRFTPITKILRLNL